MTCPVCRCLMKSTDESHQCPECSGEFFTVKEKPTVDEGEWSRQKYYKAARNSVSINRFELRAGYRLWYS
ncbi:hypothetical protein [Desulfosporosinus lacus]|uniref:Uncharacterized protein n=1 Tax=Desulfosporosinus lacus DSM 15449 TaxID=1121420 RepID=A0A1M5WFZ6_9FIRM|nr:hypothetical protein [Desulfosporosinus lacus]SHH86421.1 hypothetical protein SAMN02746098_01601 [Desulfosporosinus lacus DSM 15449]